MGAKHSTIALEQVYEETTTIVANHAKFAEYLQERGTILSELPFEECSCSGNTAEYIDAYLSVDFESVGWCEYATSEMAHELNVTWGLLYVHAEPIGKSISLFIRTKPRQGYCHTDLWREELVRVLEILHEKKSL